MTLLLLDPYNFINRGLHLFHPGRILSSWSTNKWVGKWTLGFNYDGSKLSTQVSCLPAKTLILVGWLGWEGLVNLSLFLFLYLRSAGEIITLGEKGVKYFHFTSRSKNQSTIQKSLYKTFHCQPVEKVQDTCKWNTRMLILLAWGPWFLSPILAPQTPFKEFSRLQEF